MRALQMNRVIGVSLFKLLVTFGMATGGIAAWAIDHFETKEHVQTLREARDREIDHMDKRFDNLDKKIDLLLDR